MDTALYVGLSRQMTLQRALDVTANNIANMDTAGFKVEQLSVKTDPMSPPRALQLGAPAVNYVLDDGVARDFRQGELSTTGAPLDLAIQGEGFFTVQTPNGAAYTRDGRFTLDAQNRIVDRNGDPVLGSSGSPITIDPTQSPPVVGPDGSVSQSGPNGSKTALGKIGVVKFASLGALAKSGANQFTDTGGQTPTPVADASVRQGMVEKSNVQPIAEINRLVQITRAYERVQDMMSSTQDLSAKAVDSLGKLN